MMNQKKNKMNLKYLSKRRSENMQEVKMNLDKSLYVDTENRSVTSGMINSVQEIRIDKENTDGDNKEKNR